MQSISNLFLLSILVLFSACTADSNEQESPQQDGVAIVDDMIEVADSSGITCPACGYTTVEELPTEVCLLAYDCKSCGETMHPEGDDCCVFCTHGTEKCPSIQEKAE